MYFVVTLHILIPFPARPHQRRALNKCFVSFPLRPQLGHLAVHGAGCGFRLRSDGQAPPSAGPRRAAGGAGHGEQRGHPVPVHGSLSGHQGVGVPTAAAVLLPAAGREPPGGFLQHLAAPQ